MLKHINISSDTESLANHVSFCHTFILAAACEKESRSVTKLVKKQKEYNDDLKLCELCE